MMNLEGISAPAAFRVRDMPADVRQLVERYGFDSDGNGAIDGTEAVLDALARVQRDALAPASMRELAHFVGPRLVVAATDPVHVALRSPDTDARIDFALHSHNQLRDLMGLDEETIRGASSKERVQMLDVLLIRNGRVTYEHEAKALDVLELTPEHQQANLTTCLFREGNATVILDRAVSEQGHELMQQYLHRHAWSLETVEDIACALDELGIVTWNNDGDVADFSGLMYLLSTMRANRSDAFAAKVIEDLQDRGIFAKVMPYAFDAAHSGPRFQIAGLGEVSAKEYRVHLENLFEVIPEGRTKNELTHLIVQRFGVTAPAVMPPRERQAYLGRIFDRIQTHGRHHAPTPCWRYTPVGVYYVDPSVPAASASPQMPFWALYAYGMPHSDHYGSQVVPTHHSLHHRHRYNTRRVRLHYHRYYDTRPDEVHGSVRSRNVWGSGGRIRMEARVHLGGSRWRYDISQEYGHPRRHREVRRQRSVLERRRQGHHDRISLKA